MMERAVRARFCTDQPTRETSAGRPESDVCICMCVYIIYIYIYIYIHTHHCRQSEKGEVLLRGVGTLHFVSNLGENSACQVPICAVAA